VHLEIKVGIVCHDRPLNSGISNVDSIADRSSPNDILAFNPGRWQGLKKRAAAAAAGDVLIPKRASLQLPGLLLLLASRHARAAGAPHPFEARESTGMACRLGGWRGATAREWKKDGGLIHANRRVRAGRVRGSSDLRVASSPPPTAYSPSSLAFFGPL
jgi:hypothetical protein